MGDERGELDTELMERVVALEARCEWLEAQFEEAVDEYPRCPDCGARCPSDYHLNVHRRRKCPGELLAA